jgi:probable rRNA maturation factor
VQSLKFHDHQSTRPIPQKRLSKLVTQILARELELESFQLSFVFIEPVEMARLNEKFLGHAGPTDVITFDYAEGGSKMLCGEIVICVQIAVEQALAFNTRWQDELLRYIIHGILHLIGYDDTTPKARRKMKRLENTLVKTFGSKHPR